MFGTEFCYLQRYKEYLASRLSIIVAVLQLQNYVCDFPTLFNIRPLFNFSLLPIKTGIPKKMFYGFWLVDANGTLIFIFFKFQFVCKKGLVQCCV